MALPQFANSSTPNSPSITPAAGTANRRDSGASTPSDGEASGTEEPDHCSGTFERGKWFGSSVSGSVAPASVLEQVSCIVSLMLY